MRLQHTLRTTLCSAIVLALTACAPWIKTEFDPQADFSALKTFVWVAPQRQSVESPILDSTLLDSKVQDAVTTALRARGFVPGTPDSADFIVTYHAAKDVENRSGSWSTSIGIGIGDPWWATRYPWHSRIVFSPATEQYDAAILIIDILDPSDNSLLWRGWRSKPLQQRYFTPEAVQATVTEILAEFPPGANNS